MRQLIRQTLVLGFGLTSLFYVSCKDKENNDPQPTPPSEQAINVPDAGLLQALVQAGVDTNGDGKITLTEVGVANSKLTRLVASGKNIQNMTGIEYFTNLTYLDISNNKLTTFDASKLTKLQTIIATGNELTGVLDLSNAPNLKTDSKIVRDNNNSNLTAIKVANTNKAIDLNKAEGTDKYTGDSSGNIVFKDQEFKKCLLTNTALNTDRNNEISIQEAESYTGRISCSVQIITLEDIKYFKNITELSIISNSLDSAEIIGLAKLKKLEISPLLKTINLSNLNSLEELNLNGNKFTSLTLTGLPALKKLSLSNNDKLASLNINGLTSLTSLTMLHTPMILGELDLSGLTNLITDNVTIMLGGTNNQIVSIKVATPTYANLLNNRENTRVYYSGTNPAVTITHLITDTQLKRVLNLALGRDRNSTAPITTTDAEGFTGTIDLTGVANISGLEYFKNITGLNFAGSTIATANLTPFTKLTYLTLGGANLANVTIGDVPTLKTVDISSPVLKKLDLRGCTGLTAVKLQGTTIDSMECISVATQQMVTNFRNSNGKPDPTTGTIKYPECFTTNVCN